MAIRNSNELGINLVKMANLLLTNSRLCRLLKYTDRDPLSSEKHPEPERAGILHNNIKVVPLVNEEEGTTESTIVLTFTEGKIQNNKEFKTLFFDVLVYVPLKEWIINDESLRPFLIMSEVEKSLKKKRVENLGTIKYNSFSLHLITDIMSCYRMRFEIDVFD